MVVGNQGRQLLTQYLSIVNKFEVSPVQVSNIPPKVVLQLYNSARLGHHAILQYLSGKQ